MINTRSHCFVPPLALPYFCFACCVLFLGLPSLALGIDQVKQILGIFLCLLCSAFRLPSQGISLHSLCHACHHIPFCLCLHRRALAALTVSPHIFLGLLLRPLCCISLIMFSCPCVLSSLPQGFQVLERFASPPRFPFPTYILSQYLRRHCAVVACPHLS